MAAGRGRKILLIAAGAFAAVFAVAAVVVPRLVDLNTYHDRAVREAGAALHRTVRLGDMRLSLVPPIGVRIRDITVGGSVAGQPDLLEVGEASVRLKILPLLLRREVAIGSISLRDPAVVLRRLRSGMWDLPGAGRAEAPPAAGAPSGAGAPPAGTPPPGGSAAVSAPTAIAIDHLRIERGRVHFIDEGVTGRSTTRADLEGLDLSASFEARSGRVDAEARGEIARLGLDIPGALSIKDGSLSFKGAFETAGGKVAATLSSLRLAYSGISLSGSGSFKSDATSMRADLKIDPSKLRPADLAATAAHFGVPFPAGLFGADEISLGLEGRAALARDAAGDWQVSEIDLREATLDGAHLRLTRNRRGELVIPDVRAKPASDKAPAGGRASAAAPTARGAAALGAAGDGAAGSQAGAPAPAIAFKIGRLRIGSARIEYRDEALAPGDPLQLDLRSVTLEISDLAPGARARLKLGASLADRKDLLDLQAQATLQKGVPPLEWPVDATLRVRDFPVDRLSGLLAHAAGIRAEGGSVGLQIAAKGVPSEHLSFSGKVGVHKTRAAPIPKKGSAAPAGALAPVDCDADFDLEVSGAGTRVGVRDLRFSFPGSLLSASGSFERRPDGIWVDITIPESKISPQDIRVLTPALNLEFPPGLTAAEPVVLRGRVSGPIERPESLDVTGLLVLRKVRFDSPALGKAVEDVGARVEFTRDSVAIKDLTASLGSTRVAGSLGVEHFAAPRVSFSLISDKADLGEILAVLQPAPAGAAAPSRPAAGASAGPPNPLIEKAAGRGTIRIKQGVLGKFDFAAFEGTVTLDGPRLAFDPLAFQLYGGTYRGAASAELKGKEPRYTYRMRLENINAGPMVEDNLQMKDLLGGVLTADLQLSGSGRDYDTVSRTLSGTGSVHLVDGFVGQLNVMGGIARTADLFGEATLRDLGRSISEQRTPFRELSADISVGGGRVSSRNLKLLSRDLDLKGKGSFSLAGQLDFDLKVIFSDALSQQMEREESKARYLGREGNRYAVPLTITGSLAAPSFSLDMQQVARAAVKERTRESILKRTGLDKLLGGQARPPSAEPPPAARAPSGSASSPLAPGAGSASAGGGTAPSRRLAVRIEEARLSGNFLNPALKVKGAFSGAGISHADLIVKERGGKVIYQKQRAFPAIDAYFASHDRTAPAQIAFSEKVDQARLPLTGVEVTVVLHGTDGSRAEHTVPASR